MVVSAPARTFTVAELALRWRCRLVQAAAITNWLISKNWVAWVEGSDELLTVTESGVDASHKLGELRAA